MRFLSRLKAVENSFRDTAIPGYSRSILEKKKHSTKITEILSTNHTENSFPFIKNDVILK